MSFHKLLVWRKVGTTCNGARRHQAVEAPAQAVAAGGALDALRHEAPVSPMRAKPSASSPVDTDILVSVCVAKAATEPSLISPPSLMSPPLAAQLWPFFARISF